MDQIVILILVALVALAFGYFAGSGLERRRSDSRLGTLEKEAANLREELAGSRVALAASEANLQQALRKGEDIEVRRTSQEDQLNELRLSSAAASASLTASQEQARQFASERDQNAAELARIRDALSDTTASLSRALAEREAAILATQQTKSFLDEAQTRMRAVFVEAASKVFDEKSITLDQRIKASGEASREGLEATLKPLSEKVGHFQTKIEEFSTNQARDLARFEGSIGTLQKLNQEMADATNSLARALKGNAKTRGDWGEMILDTVLKASGLVEGANYFRQQAGVDEDSGKRRSPDVIVNLPDGRKVVVDSKVNLVAWTEAVNAETSAEYEDALIRHTAAMRLHVKELFEKNYPKVVGSDSLDLTVMFVPIEGAMSSALSFHADLQTEALSKRVVFASPNTLMAMLRVIERLWIRDRIQRQVDTIGTEAGKVMDALIDFLGEFNAIEVQIKKSQDAFEKAKNRLSESNQSVVKRAQRLVEAGAKGKRAIPEQLQPIGDAAPPISLESSGADGPSEDLTGTDEAGAEGR